MSARTASRSGEVAIILDDRRQCGERCGALRLRRQTQADDALDRIRIDRLALLGDGQLALTHQAQRHGLHLWQHALPLLRLQLLGHVRGFDALAADVLRVGLRQFFKDGGFDGVAHEAYMLHCESEKKAGSEWSRKSPPRKASSPGGRPMTCTAPSTRSWGRSTSSRMPTDGCAAPSGPSRSI